MSGWYAIGAGGGAASHEDIRIAIVVEVEWQGHGSVESVGRQRFGVQGEITLAVVEIQPVEQQVRAGLGLVAP